MFSFLGVGEHWFEKEIKLLIERVGDGIELC